VARYKARSNFKLIERDFPHFAEIAVPLGGLGKRLDAMHSFHAERSIQSRRGCSRSD